MTTNTNNTNVLPTFTVTRKGEPLTFTSAFATLAEAYHALAAQQNRSEFADDLLAAARARKLSPKQVAWLHLLATDEIASVVFGGWRHPDVVAGLDLSAIVELMQRAFDAGKKFPRIVLDGVVLKRAGARSKHPGSVNITTDVDGDVWVGRINLDGTVTRGAGWNVDGVQAQLRELAADPAKVIAQHGIATGTCCYCSTALSTAESRTAGYGPICAAKHGLPWGDTTAADEADAEAKAAVKQITDAERAELEREFQAEAEADRREGESPEARAAGLNLSGRAEWRMRNPFRRDIGERY
jgi:hypothetical protein